MSDAGQDLHALFPQDAEVLHRLKAGNEHFNRLAERYHTIAKAIHLIEAEIEPAADETLEELKKERLALLDDVAVLIASAKEQAS